MADSFIRRIDKNADTREIVEYLDYLCGRISYILKNIDEENLTDDMKKRIGGK